MRTILIAHSDLMGRNICFLRRERRISMDQFCRMFDIPKDMLLALELGESRDIYLDAYMAMAEEFGIDADDLMRKDYTNYPDDPDD